VLRDINFEKYSRNKWIYACGEIFIHRNTVKKNRNTPVAKYLSRRDLSLVEKGYKDSYPCCRYGR
jgi:hypothetical protein|tara:strand:- start:276 stop:470 length:195 start_codon:yes stop_codon:yes gene_type:complete